MNTYNAYYKGKQIEVKAQTLYGAQKLAAQKLGARKTWEVTTILAEKDGQAVIHKPQDI